MMKGFDKMIRKIINIDEDKCVGCGLCVTACHEGAIQMVDGKAKLIRDDYCDGLGDCLPVCPTNAITFTYREALEYNEEAVMKAKENNNSSCSCPGSKTKTLTRTFKPITNSKINVSELTNWPIQIKLAPTNASFFNDAKLLIAADCTAFTYGNFHERFMRNHVTLIGCPKLDDIDYSDKLRSIISNNNIKSVTIVKMEVPCCSGLENAVKKALMASGKFIPWQVITISTEGDIIE